jgi:hypothetical protein
MGAEIIDLAVVRESRKKRTSEDNGELCLCLLLAGSLLCGSVIFGYVGLLMDPHPDKQTGIDAIHGLVAMFAIGGFVILGALLLAIRNKWPIIRPFK